MPWHSGNIRLCNRVPTEVLGKVIMGRTGKLTYQVDLAYLLYDKVTSPCITEKLCNLLIVKFSLWNFTFAKS
jgi:hypothetical protein